MIISYSDSNGNLLVVHGAPKEDLEKALGPISDERYAEMVWATVPNDAINPREIDSVPEDRTFRAAWKDITSDPIVDICPIKAKEVALKGLRIRRNSKLSSLDGVELAAIGSGDTVALDQIRREKAVLRAITDPIKAIQPEGEVAGDNLLEHLKELMEVEI